MNITVFSVCKVLNIVKTCALDYFEHICRYTVLPYCSFMDKYFISHNYWLEIFSIDFPLFNLNVLLIIFVWWLRYIWIFRCLEIIKRLPPHWFGFVLTLVWYSTHRFILMNLRLLVFLYFAQEIYFWFIDNWEMFYFNPVVFKGMKPGTYGKMKVIFMNQWQNLCQFILWITVYSKTKWAIKLL